MTDKGRLRRAPEGGWRIAIVEDHLLQRLRSEELLGAQRGLRVVRSASTLAELLAWLRTLERDQWPHLLLLDLVVDRGEDADPRVVSGLLAAGVRVVVLSAMASPSLVRAMLRCGVDGVLGKRDTEADIVGAVWSTLGGRQWMTPELASVIAGDDRRPKLSRQEERALVLYASGLTLAAVAQELGIKPDTAKTYLDRVKEKYDAVGRPARSKVELARAALLDELVDLAEPPEASADPPPALPT